MSLAVVLTIYIRICIHNVKCKSEQHTKAAVICREALLRKCCLERSLGCKIANNTRVQYFCIIRLRSSTLPRHLIALKAERTKLPDWAKDLGWQSLALCWVTKCLGNGMPRKYCMCVVTSRKVNNYHDGGLSIDCNYTLSCIIPLLSIRNQRTPCISQC